MLTHKYRSWEGCFQLYHDTSLICSVENTCNQALRGNILPKKIELSPCREHKALGKELLDFTYHLLHNILVIGRLQCWRSGVPGATALTDGKELTMGLPASECGLEECEKNWPTCCSVTSNCMQVGEMCSSFKGNTHEDNLTTK